MGVLGWPLQWAMLALRDKASSPLRTPWGSHPGWRGWSTFSSENKIWMPRVLCRKCHFSWKCLPRAYQAGDARDVGSICGWGRSPEVGNGNPLQFSCLGSPMDRGAWWATVLGVVKSRTQLSTHTHTHTHSTYRVSYWVKSDREEKYRMTSRICGI